MRLGLMGGLCFRAGVVFLQAIGAQPVADAPRCPFLEFGYEFPLNGSGGCPAHPAAVHTDGDRSRLVPVSFVQGLRHPPLLQIDESPGGFL